MRNLAEVPSGYTAVTWTSGAVLVQTHRLPQLADALTKQIDDMLQSVVDSDAQMPAPPDKGLAALAGVGPDAAKEFGATRIPGGVEPYDETITSERIMAVGDDAQCIYSWRGANFENIMSFPDRHENTVIHRIETNYRSTPQILALATGVLQAQPKGRSF